MSVLQPKTSEANGAERRREWVWLTPLNLHWAGVGLLVLVNLFILVQMGLLWHAASGRSPEAIAAQQVQRRTAEVAALPLRGLDAKLATATAGSDRFYRDRLPVLYSQVLGEFGVLKKKTGVRLGRVSYQEVQMLPGTEGELTEVRMDATLSGDYRPLVQLINSLERDKTFFVIHGVALTGQQSGSVSLRLRLTTYLRPDGTVAGETSSSGPAPVAASGGPAR
jgi:type IV pilus assembly protein PilO